MYLKSRPTNNPTIEITKGENHLNFDDKRDGALYIPNSYTSDKPMPLIFLSQWSLRWHLLYLFVLLLL